MTELLARLYRRARKRKCAGPIWAGFHVWGVAILAVAVSAMADVAWAQAATASDVQVKAAYLHKLPAFVEWPSSAFLSPTSPLEIGVADSDALYEELRRQVEGKTVQGRLVELRQIHRQSSLTALNVLFIGNREPREVQQLLAKTAGLPLLTITSSAGGLDAGAVLNLVELDGRIRVEASLPSAAKSGLKLSSRLLAVASRVVENSP